VEILLSLLPKNISNQISKIPPNQMKEIEEIRVRVNRPLEIAASGVAKFLPYTVQSEDADHLLNKISHFSIYALEEELKESEEKYREVFNNANDMIALNLMEDNGLPGKFIDVNEIGIERLGYSYDELMNMTPKDIVAPEKRSEMPKNALKLFEKGHARFEIIHQTKDGKKIPVEVNNHLFELKGKKVALAISRDITERKRAEEELKESHDNLELKVKERTRELEELISEFKRSNEELEQFAHVASHDLREPLRMIRSEICLL